MAALVVVGILGLVAAVALAVASRGPDGDDIGPDASSLDDSPVDENLATDEQPVDDESPFEEVPVDDEPVGDDQVPVDIDEPPVGDDTSDVDVDEDNAPPGSDEPVVSDDTGDVEDPNVTESVDAPTADEVALDVSSCSFVDESTVSFDLTNSSSTQSSYIIDIAYVDGAGERIGDEPFFVNYIRPGERAVEGAFGSVPDEAATCEIVAVERIAAESPDDSAEVTCAVTGVDAADDIATELVITNGSSEVSDYFVDFALLRDGTRIGSGFASVEGVQVGEPAPTEGFSSTPGPAEGVTCEVVYVRRIAS